MKKSILSWTSVIILGAIMLFVNGISDKVFSRFYVDLTSEGLYSLSSGTKKIVSSLAEPITLRFYYSKTDGARYPAIKLYGQQILDLLREYQRVSGGKIELEVFDPRPDTEEEEWAEKYGLAPLNLPTGENIFLGLAAVNGLGEEDSIPLFNFARQEFLEYDISKLIYALRAGVKPAIGVITPLNLKGGVVPAEAPGMPPEVSDQWTFIDQLSKFADVKFLGNEVSNIEDNIKALIVVHPKNLSEATQYAIDQYAVRGGNLFVAVDPRCDVDEPKEMEGNPLAQMQVDKSSNMPKLLSQWGVTLKEKKVVGDVRLATQVATSREAMPERYLVWLTLTQRANVFPEKVLNDSDIITSSIEHLMFPFAGAFEIKAPEGVTIDPLFRSTPDASLYDETELRFGVDPQMLLKKYVRGNEAQVLGVRVRGNLKSAFDGKPATSTTTREHISQGVSPANMIIIADVDFLADRYSAVSQKILGTKLVSLLNDNLVFAANAIEQLTGSDDLISLRSRGRFARPFSKVEEIEASAQERWKSEEEALQARLNEANQRLTQLQASAGGSQGGKKVFTNAVIDEIKKFREERSDAQRNLREVRRNLREEKESLGNWLFVINTFAVPILLIIITILKATRFKSVGSRRKAV